MTREIKFRVWNQDEKHMYYPCGDDTEILIGASGSGVLIQDYFSDYLEPMDDIIMQFTGLIDRNGKEIYESDIVKLFTFKDQDLIRIVVFKNGSFGYVPNDDKAWAGFISFIENYRFKWKNNKSNEIEIVGNIYEDKDILMRDY